MTTRRSSARSGPPPTHRARVESQIIKRRDRESKQDELWTGRKNYYEKYEKQNAKYDEWTSPRYHETHSKLLEKLQKDKHHEETLEKRRQSLRNLLHEEQQLYQIEMMIRKSKNTKSASRPSDVPTDILKSLNLTLKLEEEDRRRHEAELKLYHQWRSSNPILQHYERMQKTRDLKLSWLDQQIERKMKKLAEEEENRRMDAERQKLMEEERLKEEEFQKEVEEKQKRLRSDLDKQIEELKAKSKASEELKAKESEDMKRKLDLADVEQKRIEDEKHRIQREYALYNVKQYKMRLKQKADLVLKNLEEQAELVKRLRDLDVVERIENQMKRREIQETLHEFLKISAEQKELEKCRQKYMDFIFDSEAKLRFQQQDALWRSEEKARADLLADVLLTIKEQVDENLRKNRERQLEIVKEREEMIQRVEQYQEEMKDLKEAEARRKVETRKRIDEELKTKRLRKKQEENEELKKIDDELERVRKEEERLKEEILKMQRRQGPIRPQRSKIFL